MKTITINEPVLDDILRRQLHSMEDGQSASTTFFLMKEEIHENTTSIDEQIKEQANAIAREQHQNHMKELADARERHKQELADAKDMQRHMLDEEMAKERRVWAQSTEQKLRSARLQGQEASAKQVADLQQALTDAQKRTAHAQALLDAKEDVLKGKTQEQYVFDEVKKRFPPDNVRRAGVGQHGADIYQGVMGPGGEVGVIYWETKRVTGQSFPGAWLKTFRESLKASGAEAGIIVSTAKPGPRQQNDILAAREQGIFVCGLEDFGIVADTLRVLVQNRSRMRAIQSVKEDVKDELYDFVTGREMQTLQSILHDSLKAKAKAIKGLETQIAHLKAAMDKEVEVSNQVFAKMQEKAGVKALPPSERE